MTAPSVTSPSLRTAAWYGDRPLDLRFPDPWRVTTWWPRTPPPLSDEEIRRVLERPIGAPPLREIATGKRRPALIVDDPTRPTPAARVLPLMLREMAEAGVAAEDVHVVVATGTHGPPGRQALEGKLGRAVLGSCHVHVHDDTRDVVRLGRTSFGTPVVVNRQVAASDLVLGIGGIYPQHSTGFGGGSKLALGVLGRRSITRLHYGHPSMGGSYDTDNDFRRDLDELATLVGLRWSVSLHVDAERQIVRAACGDPLRYYDETVRFSRRAYSAPFPGDADIVISNAYPMDVSLTFMRSKGVIPLTYACPGASRVLIAACPEGSGHHGLFPFVDVPRFRRGRHLLRTALIRPTALPTMGKRFVMTRLGGRGRAGGPTGGLRGGRSCSIFREVTRRSCPPRYRG